MTQLYKAQIEWPGDTLYLSTHTHPCMPAYVPPATFGQDEETAAPDQTASPEDTLPGHCQ